MRGSRITGMGHCVPDRVVTNDDLAQYTQVCLTFDQGDKLVSEALFSTN